ncbi:hypothetical protein NC653_040202 [Populus alba x Populus x berolinensis]|uniref:Uncharacterized protein n=1 Tax=Populus alba x Populus x berolinensis TaxID=444605 RepID=A0AAD6PT24_9ROSI|nr:hypothetical protein NC653_040202 [Populus alba x Populus x berolinensis]
MLGVTNGYLTSVLMILAPMEVSVSEAELSAIAMVVFLGIGILILCVLKKIRLLFLPFLKHRFNPPNIPICTQKAELQA